MIRNKLYTKHEADINVLAEKLNDTLDNLPSCSDDETMEESEIKYTLNKAADALRDAGRAIKYFSKPVKEGRLRENGTGKFEIEFTAGGSSYPFSCGSDIEVCLQEDPEQGTEEGWYAGRVEYTDGKGYYFYGPGKPALHNGMKARVRK